MQQNNDAIRSIVADALAPSEDTAEEAEVTEEGDAETSTAQEESTTADAQTGADDEPEASRSADGTGEDAPTEYYGVDLSGLSTEERAAVIAGFQERDKFIQQLLRGKAEEPAPVEPETPAEQDEELDDSAILKALGVDDPDDPYAEQTAKVALPLAKMVLALQEEVTQVKARADVEATERYWETSLSTLESQFGKLPVNRDEVFRLSAEAGVAEPIDAYWRIMGPARQQVMTEVQKRRAALETTLKPKGTVRPKDQADTTEKPIEGKDVKDATAIAFAQLARERGMRFDNEE